MGWFQHNTVKIFSVYAAWVLMATGCTDGVSNLLDSDSGQKEDFSSVDDGIKTKFTKIETIKPTEVLTLKAEFFTFKSSDPLSLTNLLPVTFLPSNIGVETIAEGDLKFTHGFVAKFKLINTIACGKLILADLKVILCPGSINVAYAADQNVQLSLGSSPENMVEVSSLTKKDANEFSQLESEIDSVLDKDEISEAASGEVAGEDVLIEVAAEPTPTPTPVVEPNTVGAKPKSHSISQVSIFQSDAPLFPYAYWIRFAKNYMVLAYPIVIPAVDPLPERTTQRIRIYDKNFAGGFTLLKEYDLQATLADLKTLGVSPDGSQIYFGGLVSSGVSSDVVMVQLAYNRTQNIISNEKSTVIPGGRARLGTYGAHLRQSVIHKAKIDPQIYGSEKYVRFAGSGLPESGDDSRFFFVAGEIGAYEVYADSDKRFLDFPNIWIRDVLLDSAGEPDSYFVEYAATTVPGYISKHGIVSYDLGSAQFEVNYDRDVVEDIPPVESSAGESGIRSADRFDESSLLITFEKSNSVGIARLNDTQGILWHYSIEKPPNNGQVPEMDYDAADSRNLILILRDNTTYTIYLMGITFTY